MRAVDRDTLRLVDRRRVSRDRPWRSPSGRSRPFALRHGNETRADRPGELEAIQKRCPRSAQPYPRSASWWTCASSRKTKRCRSRWAPSNTPWSRSMNACRRSRSARPSSFLAFFHDSLRRCRTARIVSRQHLSPKRSRTQWTRRRNVQRGAGSAPSMGRVAAVRWAAQTTSPSSASRRGQKRDGDRPCGGTGARRGRPDYRRAPNPSPCEPAGLSQGHLRGAAVLGDVKQSQRPLTGAGVGRAQGQMTQVLRRPTPARTINS